MQTLVDLLAELKRRRVFRVAVVYAGVAFIIFQIVDATFEPLHLPDWASTLIIIILVLGFPVAVGLAWAFDLTAEGLARAYYDSARVMVEAKIQEDPEDSRYHRTLGIAYAGLGRKEEALRAGQKGMELLPISKEAMRGYTRELDLAVIYTMVGEYEAAIDKLAYLLSIPGELSVPLLKLDPTWDPLREHPRFRALVSGGLP